MTIRDAVSVKELPRPLRPDLWVVVSMYWDESLCMWLPDCKMETRKEPALLRAERNAEYGSSSVEVFRIPGEVSP